MRHDNSVFHQLLKHLPWAVFDRLVDKHRADRRVRRLTTKSQLLALLFAQLSGATSLREIEANAPFGATTTSMRTAWQIAAEAGLMDAEACRRLVATQRKVIDRELASARCGSGARETLIQMGADYRRWLSG